MSGEDWVGRALPRDKQLGASAEVVQESTRIQLALRLRWRGGVSLAEIHQLFGPKPIHGDTGTPSPASPSMMCECPLMAQGGHRACSPVLPINHFRTGRHPDGWLFRKRRRWSNGQMPDCRSAQLRARGSQMQLP